MYRTIIQRLVFFTLLLGLLSCRIQAQKTIEDIGHITQLALPVSALGVSLIKGDRDGVIQLGTTVVVESVLVYALKNVIDRRRPSGGGLSFPSGHTALSFTSSTYLYKRYGWQYGVPATILSTFVGYSRFGIDEPVHHLSDVLAGAALGVVTALVFTKRQIDEQDLSISGGWNSDSYALGIKIRLR